MNSDARRLQRPYDIYDRPNLYQAYYSFDRAWDRFSNPAVVVSVVVLVLGILYQAASQQGRTPPLSSVLWNVLVFAIPARLLYAIDNWLNPPLFPLPMLQTPSRTHAAKSDVLRRLLGVDKPGSLIMSVSQAGRRSLTGISSVALGLKTVVEHPPGLGNYDNSCYQNSILQSLASLKPLPNYLASIPAGEKDIRPVDRMADALRTLIADLNDGSNNGRTLWTPGVLKNMSTWQQQDAQEYFSKLLDEIDKEIAKATKSIRRPPSFDSDSGADSAASQHSDDSGYQSLSTISRSGSESLRNRNPLEGLIAQRVACVACGYCEGLSMIPFNCLTLNLGINRSEHDLYERLDHYTKVEPIQGVECAKCSLLKVQSLIKTLTQRHRGAGKGENEFPELYKRMAVIEEALEEETFDDKTLVEKCKMSSQQRVSSTKTKQAVIARAPQSLVVHMNRSVFDENTGRMFKNLAAVRFPMTLDLGPWCLGSADKHTGHGDRENVASTTDGATDDRDEEQWLLGPTTSMVAGDQHASRITGPIYELRAVVTHFGGHENGHYVCYRRHTPPSASKRDKAGDGAERPPKLAFESHDDEVSSLDEMETPPAEDETTMPPADEEEPVPQWWRLSDQDVTKVDENRVLAQGGVFMLFYDCVDPNSVLLSDINSIGAAEPAETSFEDSAVSEAESSGTSGSTDSEEEEGSSSQEDTDVSTTEDNSDDHRVTRGRPSIKRDPPLLKPDVVLAMAASVALPKDYDDVD